MNIPAMLEGIAELKEEVQQDIKSLNRLEQRLNVSTEQPRCITTGAATQAVRNLFQQSEDPITAVSVKHSLLLMGFFKGSNYPSSSTHTILSRLVAEGLIVKIRSGMGSAYQCRKKS